MNENIEMVIQETLRKNMSYDYISFREYQDKYFLLKQLRALLPSFPDKVIYRALDSFSEEERERIKLSRFIEKFSNRIASEYLPNNNSNRG